MPNWMADRFTVSPSGCWIWLRALDKNGYGVTSSKTLGARRAHRVSYEHFVGAIAKGLVIDHLCRVRSCINPSHLEAVTQKTNIARTPRCTATHCKRGHLYTADSVYICPRGKKNCRYCMKIRVAKYLDRKEVLVG